MKDSGYYINGNFNKAALNIRVELWDKVKQLRGADYYVVIKYDRIVRNKLFSIKNKCVQLKIYIKT